MDKQDWIGAFRLSETRYVLVGVRQGAIMAGRDGIGARTDVESLLHDTVQLAEDAGEQWDAVYAPEEFGTAWPDMPLATLLPKSALKSSARLESLTGEMSPHQKRLFFGIAAGMVLSAAGGWAWHTHIVHMKQQAAALANETVTLPAPHPWKSMATVPVQLATWRQVIDRVPLFIAGWRAEDATLDAGKIAITYRRDGGLPVDAFQAAAMEIFGSAPELANKGEQAKVEVGFQPAATGEDEALPSQDDALVAFTSHFQALGLDVPDLSKSKETAPEPPRSMPGGPRQVYAAPDWQSFGWAISIPVLRPDLLGHVMPGLRLTTMKVVFSDGSPQWELQGMLYVKD